jgi:hypothetical protein
MQASMVRVTDWLFLPWTLVAQVWARLGLTPETLTQAINPWNTVVNINSNNSAAPEIERAVLTKYSYGRQLGRLNDVVALLVKRLEDSKPSLSSEEERAIAQFTALEGDVDKMKKAGLALRVGRVVDDLESLRRSDPVAFGKLTERLRKLFREAPTPRLSS